MSARAINGVVEELRYQKPSLVPNGEIDFGVSRNASVGSRDQREFDTFDGH